ncbi:MAG: M12 family metallo-peptidase, partial [Phycisphaerales bacterium]|nr:M12 family metallo-peptidase [Phycisphaerales bacterium]
MVKISILGSLAISATVSIASASVTGPAASPSVEDACHALDLRDCAVQRLHLDPLGDGGFQLDVVFQGQDRRWVFHPHSNRGEGYQVLVQVEGGAFVQHDPSPLNTWRGIDADDPESTAAMAMEHDGFRVQFRDGDGTVWFVEPLIDRARSARFEHYAVYSGADIISPDAECGTNELWRVFEHSNQDDAATRSGDRGNYLLVADMAVDVDYAFYDLYNNSVSAVENRVNAVINAVNSQYESQIEVTHEIQAIVVRTSLGAQPYGTNVIETLLEALRADWNSGNHPGIDRDIVHLFTGENTGSTIGLAYLGGLCSSYEYGVVQSSCCGSFGCATDLSAHEMGHNWNSGHCTCPGWTMNPSLTCGNQFTDASVNTISGFRDANEGCLEIGGFYGACCYATTCIERYEVECAATGGAFQGADTNCGDIECDLSSGACCTQSGNCNNLTESQCDLLDGTYYGDGFPCDAVDCTVGACCTGTDCTLTTEALCGGVWLGPDTDCDGDGCLANDFSGIKARVVGVNLVDGGGQDTWTVDIYADLGAGERIDAVAGTTAQLKTVTSTLGFWQHQFGGATSMTINPALYTAFPDLVYDSRVTIGALDQSGDPFDDNNLGSVGIDFGNFENGGSLAVDDGTWYVLPTDAQGTAIQVSTDDCNSGFGVLVARLTAFGLDSEVTLGALFQGRNVLGNTFQVSSVQTFSLGDWADCNGNGTSDTCDIASGNSTDADGNGIPDECESTCPWDLDGDGDTDVDDLLAVISG